MSEIDDVIQFAKRHGASVIPLSVALRAQTELFDLRESEPKKIKRLRILIEELKQCNDQLRANLLELETK
jgi:hypothetical protein